MYAQAAKLSCALQANSVTIFDVTSKISKTCAALTALKTKPACEAAFLADCKKDQDANVFRTTCHLESGDTGRTEVQADRVAICDGLSEHLESRFMKVLN